MPGIGFRASLKVLDYRLEGWKAEEASSGFFSHCTPSINDCPAFPVAPTR